MTKFERDDTADFLDGEVAALRRRGDDIIRDIERLEKELVNLREHRDRAFRLASEMTVAANIIRDVGLRSEIRAGSPFVEMDYVPKRPDPS